MNCLNKKGVPIGLLDVNKRPIRNGDLLKYIPTSEIFRVEYDNTKAAFVAVRGAIRHLLHNTYAASWYVIEPERPCTIVVDNPLNRHKPIIKKYHGHPHK